MKHRDKLHHMVYSFALAIAGAFLFGPTAGVVLALAVGVAKELVWDGLLGRGHPDVWDMLANCVGVMAALVVLVR